MYSVFRIQYLETSVFSIQNQHPVIRIQYPAFRNPEFRIQNPETRYTTSIPWFQYKNRWRSKYLYQKSSVQYPESSLRYPETSSRPNISESNLLLRYLDFSTRTDDTASIFVTKISIQKSIFSIQHFVFSRFSTRRSNDFDSSLLHLSIFIVSTSCVLSLMTSTRTIVAFSTLSIRKYRGNFLFANEWRW